MKNSEFTETNRIMWNETADAHTEGYVRDLFDRIAAPDFTTFDDVEEKLFNQISLTDKAVAQLGCNNGRELIAIKKAGAGDCVGFDISEKFIAQAIALANAADVDVNFVCTDFYNISSDHDGQFDLIYISVGVLGWLPDLDQFFEIVSRFLKTDGQLFIYEMHPALSMYESHKGLSVQYSYFHNEPNYADNVPDYMDSSKVISAPSYWFHHKLSDIIGCCIQHQLNLTHFKEYEHDISAEYAAFENLAMKPPLCYSLLAIKTAR